MKLQTEPFALESAALFVPGGSSYITERLVGYSESDIIEELVGASGPNIGKPETQINWVLAERSQRRAEMVPRIFDQNFHDQVIFSAGYPGVAAGWNQLGERFIPPPGQGEATPMSGPLRQHLRQHHWTEQQIEELILTFDRTGDSFGDVIGVIDAGILDPEDFKADPKRGLVIVAGRQAMRHAAILSAVGIPAEQIRGVAMKDAVNRKGGGKYPPKSENVATALLIEEAALFVTRRVLQGRRPGIDGVRAAQEQFAEVAAQGGLGVLKLFLQKPPEDFRAAA